MRLTALHRGTGDAASERVISEAEGGARVPTILVIEDRPVDRKLLTLVLRSGGNDVIEASDGEEALEIIQRNDVDLVISDILMPTVDGYEFVRRLRELPSGGSTPVIFYTATYHEREARALAERCGVSAILDQAEPRGRDSRDGEPSSADGAESLGVRPGSHRLQPRASSR